MVGAFELLHGGVQRWLYEQRWTALRPIQVEAIQEIRAGTGDLIVAARTASGKTEAAFLPILSTIADDHEGSVRALYIGPLRALINDQFRRMELLCADLGIPVHKWHGEVGQAERRAVVTDPGGVLMITPESLEAFFIRRSSHINKVFGRLAFVVIDELHVFPGSERGMHLRSLLHRLEQRTSRFRRIGLSATLGDLNRYKRWMHPDDPDSVALINHPRDGAEIKTRCYAFPGATGNAQVDAVELDPAAPSQSQNVTKDQPVEFDELASAVLAHHRNGINLVFANAKRRLEEIAASLQVQAAVQGIRLDRILVHHGSLSRELREEAETLLQEGGDRICCCSSTLELGVDIGSVKAVAHLGAPWSVASLAQRLGRSGRREGESAVFRQYHTLEPLVGLKPSDETHLRLELVRGVALMQLYLEGWCESPLVTRSHFSTLVHQIMSMIAETGGTTAERLYGRLVGGNGFEQLDPAGFGKILRHLGSLGVLEQMPDGTLLLGPEGEREVGDKGFYAAFVSIESYEVIHDARRIGTVSTDNVYLLGDGFRLGGRGWEVAEIDKDRLRIYVRPSSKRDLPQFSGQGGQIDDQVVVRMREVLCNGSSVDLLNPMAAEALQSAREHFHRNRLDSLRIQTTEGGVTLWPWRGSRIMDTLMWVLRSQKCGGTAGTVSIEVPHISDEAIRSLLSANVGHVEKVVMAGIEGLPPEMLWKEKYDKFTHPSLFLSSFAAERLDFPGSERVIREMLDE